MVDNTKTKIPSGLPRGFSSKNSWFILAITFLGACMVGIDSGIMNVALPILTKQFQISLSITQWTITGYLLALCAVLPLSGRFGDLYTKRTIYLLGLAFFTISSLFCSMAANISQLILFRIMQGVGGAMIVANCQALIVMNFPKEKLGRALGISSMATSLGLILGPSIGGFLIGAFGWPSIFIINIPIGLVGVYVGYKILPRNESKMSEKIDIVGAILFAAGLSIILLTLSNGLDWHWSISKIITYSVIGIGILCSFLVWESQIKEPMINLIIFKNWDYSLGNIAVFLVFMCIATNNLLLPFLLQSVFNISIEVVGLFLFIPSVVMMFLAPISGYISDFIDQAILIIIGLAIITIAMLVEAFIQVGTSLWTIGIAQLLLGIGVVMFIPPNNSSTLATVSIERIGIATSINGLIRNSGKIFGTALTAMLFVEMQHRYSHIPHVNANAAFTASFRFSFILASILTFVAILFTIKRLPIFKKRF